MKPTLHALALVVALAAVVTGCNGASTPAATNTINIAVTDNGFEPAVATVEVGKPVTLVVTRKTDQTCATALIFDEDKIKHELPLNRAVTITFTPTKAGEMRYACPMNMIEGKLIVR